ncbi:MAG TPA: CapA family protein, partial [Treponemataceae bacterium]|nr:CapA family protein [Treponemataceae bacterium]
YMYKKTITLQYIVVIFSLAFLFSCKTTKTDFEASIIDIKTDTILPEKKLKPPLILTFCGDLMCHTENFKTSNYADIYKDIGSIISNDSLTFANLETPVNNDLPYSTFPIFNAKNEYVIAAINAGIDVFSLANNHTNDGGIEGILKTASFFETVKKKGVYSAGIHTGKNESGQPPFKTDGLSYQIIEKDGWKILFAAYTQILNNTTGLKYIDFYPPIQKHNNELVQQLLRLQSTHEHDLFILSVHSATPEYVIDVSTYQKKWYKELEECGVDIIWANHPHVLQEWEMIVDSKTYVCSSIIMHSLGNLISGQRRPWPNLQEPDHKYEYTGDSILLQMTIIDNTIMNEGTDIRTKNFQIEHIHPVYITTHITKWQGDYIIKQLTPEFISSQPKSLQTYYTKRLELIQKIKGKITWR